MKIYYGNMTTVALNLRCSKVRRIYHPVSPCTFSCKKVILFCKAIAFYMASFYTFVLLFLIALIALLLYKEEENEWIKAKRIWVLS